MHRRLDLTRAKGAQKGVAVSGRTVRFSEGSAMEQRMPEIAFQALELVAPGTSVHAEVVSGGSDIRQGHGNLEAVK
ncbi:hypothetical protein [Streptomyces sp. NPDC088785]|uniref:hypothetical protein n=1 Tax=Streptomyces sp. NPDC088785 TaxID=3365897 RepID=UPI00381E9369